MKVKLYNKGKYGYGIPVQINGITYKFLLDTGCEKSIIFSSKANNWHMHKVQYNITDSSGHKTELSNAIMVDNVKIGSTKIDSIELLVINNMIKGFKNRFVGILGMDILGKLNYKISFVEQYLDILSYSNGNIEHSLVDVNGIKTKAIFDTGSNFSWIANNALFEKNRYRKKFVIQYSINRVCVKRKKVYQQLVLKGNDFKSDSCSILEGREVLRNGEYIDLVIGLDILKNMKLEYKNGRWTLERTDSNHGNNL